MKHSIVYRDGKIIFITNSWGKTQTVVIFSRMITCASLTTSF
jgi:hypothetical protein